MSERENGQLKRTDLNRSPYWHPVTIVVITASMAIVENYFAELAEHKKAIVLGLLAYVFLHLAQLVFRMLPIRVTNASKPTNLETSAPPSHKNILRYLEDREFRFYAYEVDFPGMVICFLFSLWLGGQIFSDSLGYGSMAIWALLTSVYFWAVRYFFGKHIRPS